jgi:CDP-diglyceride synthetase
MPTIKEAKNKRPSRGSIKFSPTKTRLGLVVGLWLGSVVGLGLGSGYMQSGLGLTVILTLILTLTLTLNPNPKAGN